MSMINEIHNRISRLWLIVCLTSPIFIIIIIIIIINIIIIIITLIFLLPRKLINERGSTS